MDTTIKTSISNQDRRNFCGIPKPPTSPRITVLTPEQIAQFPFYCDKWIKVGLDTNAASRPEAEAAARQGYECVGLPPPKTIIWLNSPLEGAIGSAILTSLSKSGRVALGDQDWRQIWAQAYARLWDDARFFLWSQEAEFLHSHVRNETGDQVFSEVWDHILKPVQAQIEHQILHAIVDQARAHDWQEFGESARRLVDDDTLAHVWDQIKVQLMGPTGDLLRVAGASSGAGSLNVSLLSVNEFFLEQCDLNTPEQFQANAKVARNCGWYWLFEDTVILTERPDTLMRDDEHRLHCATGPALRYPDGWSLYRWHGVAVPKDVIENPARITPQQIALEINDDVRQVMIERFGALDSGH